MGGGFISEHDLNSFDIWLTYQAVIRHISRPMN
jgi:hypothetical protein